MAKITIKKASTDVTVYVFIQDSSATTGAGLTGLTFETASLVASYVRPLAARAALTLATQTVTGAHSDGGFVEVDATNMPGVYRLDLPDAVCATGVGSVVVMLKGAANMAPVLLEIQLTDFDLNTNGVTLASTQGAITWGQQKIAANVASQGALDIQNSSTSGYGILTKGYMGAWLEGNVDSAAGYGLYISGNGGVNIYGKNTAYGGVIINGANRLLELCANNYSINAKNNVRGFDPEIVNQIQESLTEAVEPLASIPADVSAALELAQPKAVQLPPEEGE